MKKIYDLSWNKDGFFDKVSLVKKSRQEVKVAKTNNKVGTLSALSSTYYSVAGTAIAQLRSKTQLSWKSLLLPLWFVTWLPLGAWCYWRMLPISNKALRIAGEYQNLSVSQCDDRQSILRRRGQLDEALFCINSTFYKEPVGHTLALLLVGKADVLERQNKEWGNFSEIKGLIYRALDIAKEIESDEPQQAIRIYRNCANLVERIGEDGSLLRKKAKQIAQRVGAKDQLLKI